MKDEEKIKELERKIEQQKNIVADLILKAVTPECTSHIYKTDLWGVMICIFCGRKF